MRRHIPNILTLANLFSGCIAITMAFQGNLKAVVIWVVVAALFDFLDGVFARWLKAYSDMGKELDSLADVVSFGVAPAAAVFVLLRDYISLPSLTEPLRTYIPYLAFMLPLCSAWRLAKFNIDEQHASSFKGLPTPANGLFWVSYSIGIQELSSHNVALFYVTAGLIFLFSWLMISEIPMFSLKIKKITWKDNERQWILAALMIVFVVLRGITGVVWGIIAYIVLSITTLTKKIVK